MRARVHACTRTCMHARVHACVQSCIRACVRVIKDARGSWNWGQEGDVGAHAPIHSQDQAEQLYAHVASSADFYEKKPGNVERLEMASKHTATHGNTRQHMATHSSLEGFGKVKQNSTEVAVLNAECLLCTDRIDDCNDVGSTTQGEVDFVGKGAQDTNACNTMQNTAQYCSISQLEQAIDAVKGAQDTDTDTRDFFRTCALVVLLDRNEFAAENGYKTCVCAIAGLEDCAKSDLLVGWLPG